MNNILLKSIILLLLSYSGFTSCEILQENRVANDNVGSYSGEETEDNLLQKINFYTTVFINLYFISFILIIFVCARCGNNVSKDRILMAENGDLQNDVIIKGIGDTPTRNNICTRFATISNETFASDWVNYENIYENTYS